MLRQVDSGISRIPFVHYNSYGRGKKAFGELDFMMYNPLKKAIILILGELEAAAVIK